MPHKPVKGGQRGGGRRIPSAGPPVHDAHIQMLEPELAAATAVPFDALASPTGAAQLRKVLDDHGFAVVTGVLDQAGVQAGEGLWAEDLKSIIDARQSPNGNMVATITRDPIHEWPCEQLPVGTKFASDFGLPQGRLGWWVRQHPRAKAVYEALYEGQSDLIVGMDNIFFNTKPVPPVPDEARTSSLWPHADQNGHLPPHGNYRVYQGVLYFWGATADTAATVVWPGSHKEEYDRLMAERTARGHFVMMQKKDFGRFAACARRVPVPPGGMLLWSSRTIHQGWPNGPRLAVPVCFEPRGHRKDAGGYGQKMQCVLDGLPTTHWASIGKTHALAGKPEPLTRFDCGVALRHAAHHHALDEAGANVDEKILALL